MEPRLVNWAERGKFPDFAIRFGIRRLLQRRLKTEARCSPAEQEAKRQQFAEQLSAGPIAVATAAANEQHYEVPSQFFELVLGSYLKYSCGYWTAAETTLDESEAAMLRLTCERAELANGMRILELGCGWGSLSLWIARHYPDSQILAISNSHNQRQFIEARCRELGLGNLLVQTANVAEFTTEERFDRIVSIEMFEHLRNYREMLRRIACWLQPEGRLFVHVFCHREVPYTFETNEGQDWMARHFFSGGIMPCSDLFEFFTDDLKLRQRWEISGLHYSRTCEAWLTKLDQNRVSALEVLGTAPQEDATKVRLQRWRMFFMACSELFRYGSGNEWFVSHNLLQRS